MVSSLGILMSAWFLVVFLGYTDVFGDQEQETDAIVDRRSSFGRSFDTQQLVSIATGAAIDGNFWHSKSVSIDGSRPVLIQNVKSSALCHLSETLLSS